MNKMKRKYLFFTDPSTDLCLCVMIEDNLLLLQDEYPAELKYYVKCRMDSSRYLGPLILNVWFHYCTKLIFVLKFYKEYYQKNRFDFI